MLNLVTLIGRVGKEPVVRKTDTGKEVANISVAASKKWTAADGTQREQTVWFNVSAWEKTAGIIAKYVHKGDVVTIVGEIEEPRPWLDKDGTPRASNQMTAQRVVLMPNERKTAGMPDDIGETDEEMPF